MQYYGLTLAPNTVFNNLVVESGPTFPTNIDNKPGRLFYKTDDSQMYYYNGTTWVVMKELPVTFGISDFKNRNNDTRTGSLKLTGDDLPFASSSAFGAIKISGGNNQTAASDYLNIDNGVLSFKQPAPEIPTGTRMLFLQASAPVGWTQDTTTVADNRMLRVVSTAFDLSSADPVHGNEYGGTESPILMNHSLPHAHTMDGMIFPAEGGVPGNVYVTSSTGADTVIGLQVSTHVSVTGTSTNAWTPKYVNAIICTKN